MFLVILLALLAVPIAELVLIAQVADGIGIPETIFLLLAVSVAGAWLVRREGLGLLGRIDLRLRAGEMPTDDLLDGLFVLVAGALMLTPGFITDAVGLLLLVPFTRRPLRGLVQRRFNRRLDRYRTAATAGRGGTWFTDVTDVTDVTDAGPRPPDAPRSRPPSELGQG